MKIAMLLRRLNVKGGTQRQALSLAIALRKEGHKVDIYSLYVDKENCYPEMLNLFTVRELPKKDKENAEVVGAPWNLISAVAQYKKENQLARALATFIPNEYDLLNPHDQIAYRTAYYFKKLTKNIPAVWNMNDLPLKMWGYDRARGCDEHFKQPFYRVLVYKLFDWYDTRKFTSKMDAICVVDVFNRNLVRDYMGLRAFTVRSGPDFEHFSYKEKVPPKKREVKLLTSGILMPHRRYEDAIVGTRILRDEGYDARLTIMGDYENDMKYYNKLKTLIADLDMSETVTFTGRVPEAQLIASYHDNDIYTFQHHLQSDGLSPFEAAACGMPLIVSETAGCHEVLTHDKNAQIVKPKDPEDYALKVKALIDNPIIFKEHARAGNEFVREHFSWEKYANGILSVAKEAMRAPTLSLAKADEENDEYPKRIDA